MPSPVDRTAPQSLPDPAVCGGEPEVASKAGRPAVDPGSSGPETCAASARRAQQTVAGVSTADGQCAPAAVAYLVSRAAPARVAPPAVAPPAAPAEPVACEGAERREATLCEKRKGANSFLCDFLGSVVSSRTGPAASPGWKASTVSAMVSMAVAESCKQAMNWLEENAPGGACR